MSLLDLYLEKCAKSDWRTDLQDEKNAYLFEFTANFRTLDKFEEGFRTFMALGGDDSGLNDYSKENPQQLKRFMNNMMRTKLFYRKGDKTVLTAKGEVFKKFLGEKMSADDRWFVDFLFVADSYFALTTNYIFTQTEYVFAQWEKAGYTIGQIYNALIYLFNVRDVSMEEFMRTEYIVMITFLSDPDFLRIYRESGVFEKNALHEYLVDNYSKGRYNCMITAKFSPTSLTDCDTVLDDAKILFFAHYIKNSHPIGLEDMLDIFEGVYTRFYRLNAKRVLNFVMMYEDVFRMTYLNLFSDMQELKLDESAYSVTRERLDEEGLRKAFFDPLDYTTTETMETLVKANTMFAAAAKAESGYKCALSDIHGCKSFTDKETGLPYLEVHQLIPRDYAGEFGQGIERVSNYVALCPHCHKLIHHASDDERFRALSALYWSRKERLDADGIVPTSEMLFAIYGIEQKKLAPGQNDFSKPLLQPAQPKLAAGRSGKKTTRKKK